MQNNQSYKYHVKIILLLVISFSIFSSPLEARKKRRKSHRVPSASIIIKQSDIISQKNIQNGAVYKNLHLGNGKSYFNVHVTEVDLKNDSLEVFVHKMGNQFNHLESLPKYVNSYNCTFKDSIFSAVNANFWKAYSNAPIGPCIIDGIVVENQQHKNWSGLLIDKFGVPYINNYDINGSVKSKGFTYSIDYINRRRDSSGICYYNQFGGDTIPFVHQDKINDALTLAIKEWKKDQESMGDDSTEQVFDSTAFIDNYKQVARGNLIEQGMYKVLLRYISEPFVNTSIKAVVAKYTSNFIELPPNYCIISFGTNIPLVFLPDLGDTLEIMFKTNLDNDKIFKYGVSGTPRLARKGEYSSEAIQEGNSGKRFINTQLPRTLIGYNEDKSKFYLITVEGTISSRKQYGANLNDLTKIVKNLNLYDAMNLDGGGSSAFVLDGQNLMRDYSPLTSRKLSVIIGVKKSVKLPDRTMK